VVVVVVVVPACRWATSHSCRLAALFLNNPSRRPRRRRALSKVCRQRHARVSFPASSLHRLKASFLYVSRL
jgi:hypothetical protein